MMMMKRSKADAKGAHHKIHTCITHQFTALWIELRALDLGNSVWNPLLPYQTLGKFVHSTLLKLTQLYESVPGYRQLWTCVNAH